MVRMSVRRIAFIHGFDLGDRGPPLSPGRVQHEPVAIAMPDDHSGHNPAGMAIETLLASPFCRCPHIERLAE